MNKGKYVYQEQAGDGSQGGGGGGQGGQQQGAGGQQQGQQQGSVQQQSFKDVASARTFLTDYVHDGEFLKSVPDEKVMPWAARVKSKFDEHGSQFPEGWRKLVAGENAEHLKTLERFQSPKALYDSYAALRSKMSSGELKQVVAFPDKGTPEQQAAWRTDNGLPLEPTGEKGYQIKLPDGVVLGEQDKPVIEEFKKAAHASHMSPEQVSASVGWYLADRERQAEERHEKNLEARAATEDALRAEWGQDYRGNVNRITGFLETAPKGVGAKIANALGPDGGKLMNDPDVMRWLVDLARESNPAGVNLPGGGGTLATSVQDEIGKWEEKMADKSSDYWKGPNAEKNQQRYRDLVAARDQMKGREKKAA